MINEDNNSKKTHLRKPPPQERVTFAVNLQISIGLYNRIMDHIEEYGINNKSDFCKLAIQNYLMLSSANNQNNKPYLN